MLGKRNAWVSFAFDETTATESIVLSKSLCRVVTAAETVVLVPHDAPKKIRVTLARYFDVVRLEHIVSNGQSERHQRDLLKIAAWNLGMYQKCVVLDPNTMVLQNSDEIFDYEGILPSVFLNSGRGKFDTTVLLMKPCIETYSQLLKVENSQRIIDECFNTFSESFNTLPWIYNYRISSETNRFKDAGIPKIVSFEPLEGCTLSYDIQNNNGKVADDTLAILNIWKSMYNDIDRTIFRNCDSQRTSIPSDIAPSQEMYTNKKSYYKEAIAIVGHSCRFPGANDSNEFWELLRSGSDAICQIPPERLLEWQRHDPRFTESKAGFLKCKIDEFDAEFFGISPKEAKYMDPQQRLLLEVTWEALEDAAINPQSLKGGNSGVFSGVWTHDYERLISEHTSGEDNHLTILGNAFSATSSRISHYLGVNGPNIATESGCSSSMVALHLACDSLRRGETDLGLVLGANILILQFPLSEIPILAQDGHCKTYDEKADGFGRAEGAAVIVLKRLSDAIANGDRIMGIIRGSGLSNEGTTSSFGTPSKICQEIAIQEALKNSGVHPEEIDYVEAHGTGTPVGDPIEFAALSAGYTSKVKSRGKPLVVGSVKTNIGHTESAAGLAGVIKVLLAMKHETLPLHRNFESLNPNINLEIVPSAIPTENLSWPRNPERVRLAGVSSFGISGTNVHAIVEEPPTELYYRNNIKKNVDRSHYILTLSAKSKTALELLANRYVYFLNKNLTSDIADVTYTANNGRAHLEYRLFVTATNISDLKGNLNQVEYLVPKIQSGDGKIAFLFSDEDEHYLGMAKCLYDSSFIFKSAFKECDALLKSIGKPSLTDFLWDRTHSLSLSKQNMYKTCSTFALQYSLLKLWTSLGIKPEFVVGYGIGEFVAAIAAEILNLKDASILLLERLIEIPMPYYRRKWNLSNIKFKKPNCGFISGSTGIGVKKKEMNADYWIRPSEERAKFSKVAKILSENKCNIFVEIGVHPTLLSLGKKLSAFPDNVLLLPSIRQDEMYWKTFLNSLGVLFTNHIDIEWKSLDESMCRRKVELPFYPFERSKFWVNIDSESCRAVLRPLLGKSVILASKNIVVYEHTWNLKDLSYLGDHQVANTIVFPGAGFLEVILAAGVNCFSNGNKGSNAALQVKDFVIESPFELEENKNHKIQVVCTTLETGSKELLVRIYVYQKLNGYNNEKGWKQFSSGIVRLVEDNSKDGEDGGIPIIQSRCQTEKSGHEFYKLAPQIGIVFGETFQSVETVWEGNNEILGKVKLPSKAGSAEKYVFHPIILDAMIQTFGLSIARDQVDLYLPVGIQNFTMVNDMLLEDFYFAHAKWSPGATTGTVTLFSQSNRVLAVMTEVRLLRTSVGAFLNVINSQKNKLPGMYQEVWRVRDGPAQSRVELKELVDPSKLKRSLVDKNVNATHSICVSKDLSEIISLAIMEVVQKNGFHPQIGKFYNCRAIMQNNLMCPLYIMYFCRLFEILSEDGYFVPIVSEYDFGISEEWEMVKPFLEYNLLEKNMLKIISRSQKDVRGLMDLVWKYKEIIWNVLQGKEDVVKSFVDSKKLNSMSLYGNDENTVSYTYMSDFIVSSLSLKEQQPGVVVRILEIGGGNSMVSKNIIGALQKAAISFRYTLTDISSDTVEKSKKLFPDTSGIECRVLDIEKDPSLQGFCPFYYDVVVCANVLHSTERLKIAVRNVRSLLVPNGLFLMQEMLQPSRYTDFMSLISDSYWRFKDYEIRKHPIIPKDDWDTIFRTNGFSHSTLLSGTSEVQSVLVTQALKIENCVDDYDNSFECQKPTWILFSDDTQLDLHLCEKFTAFGRNVLQIKNTKHKVFTEKNENEFCISLGDYTELFQTLDTLYNNHKIVGTMYICSNLEENSQELAYLEMMNLCKYIARRGFIQSSFHVVTRGAYYTNNQTKVNPSCAPIMGMFKSLKNEQAQLDGKIIDLDPDRSDPISESSEIFFELFDDEETIVSYRNRKRLVSRFIPMSKPLAPVVLPHGRYTVEIPKSKKLNDVKFCAAKKTLLGMQDIEVAVKAFALNFRDIFVILKPDMYSTIFDAVGTDFAGVVSQTGSSVTKYKVGDEVFGISQASSAASHVIVNSNMVLRKPKSFTFADASTIPTVFLTAYHCMISIANLKRGETILIHVASGGVGLVAIQIAKHIGAKIIATAGSHRKRAYLKSLGLDNVFHSRDLTYASEIERVTENKGVDVVLNSLTGIGFKEATLKICAQAARFVEIGKVNIWQPEDVRKLRPDVLYTIADLEKVSEQEMTHLMTAMQKVFHNPHGKTFTPLPYSRYEMENIRDALNYFLKAQHIGKIVVAAPEFSSSGNSNFSRDMIFNDNASYLITGGLGGIGLEVAKWMSDCGAKNIILVGRSLPNEKSVKAINNIKANGCQIISLQVDIGIFEQCKIMFEKIKHNCHLPPLRGIIHSAVALSDGVFTNQTWAKYESVFNAKIKGTWNLHQLTKSMQLEHFVLFSSVASIFGPMGQSNYASSNAFLDSFAHYRHSIGLAAQVINWGAWSEVGSATNTAYGKEGSMGIKPFTPNQGIAALKFVMTRPHFTQLSIIQLDIDEFKLNFAQKGNFLSELVNEKESTPTHNTVIQSDTFWMEIKHLSIEERFKNIKLRLEAIIRVTLKLPKSEPLDEHQTFSDMGLDSLMAVEMRNKLQNIFGKKITLNANSLFEYQTINALSKHLAELTLSVKSSERSSNKVNTDMGAVYELVKSDSVLPEDIQKVGEIIPLPQARSALVTGSTGRLGPYILRDLQQNTNLKIFCLIKAKSVKYAQKKLKANILKFKLHKEIDIDKISIVVGNITSNQLGLSDEEYGTLAESVDCIFHLAAKANHVDEYAVNKSNTDIRSVNVLGTLNVLRFASHVKTKSVVFPSTFAAVNRLTDDGFASEEFPTDDNYGDGISMGYLLSKFVCEKLMKEANIRGIPCTVIRYPTLIGDSQTGVFTIDTDSFLNFIFLSCRLGIAPDILGAWYCLPVDVASKLTVDLAFSDYEGQPIFNLFQPVGVSSKDFVIFGEKTGVKVEVVKENVFSERLQKESKTISWLSMFADAYESNFISAISGSNLMTDLSINKGKSVYCISDKLQKIIPNIVDRIPNIADIMQVYVDFAKSSKLFEKLGIGVTDH